MTATLRPAACSDSSIACTRNGFVRRKPHPRVRPLGRAVDLGRVEKLVNGWHAWPVRSTTQYGPFTTRRAAIDALLGHGQDGVQ